MMSEANEKPYLHEILVVDDKQETLQLLTNILSEQGYLVRPASSGEMALRSVAAKPPYLVLLDVKMAEMDGFEVCRRLKADEQSREIPVIFVTGLVGSADRIKGFAAGALDYILKPFEPEDVLARVGIHVRLRELTEHLEQMVRERTEELSEANRNLQQEVAERKQAEEALRQNEWRFRDLLASVINYMYTVVIADGRPISTTHGQGCLAVTGFSAEEYAADPNLWYRMILPEDQQAVLKATQGILTSSSADTFEHRIRHKDGSVRWVQTTLVPNLSYEGQLLSYDGVITDITERKQALEKLYSLNEELEQRVKERTKDLERRNRDLEQMQQAFVSRELRMVELKGQIVELEKRE